MRKKKRFLEGEKRPSEETEDEYTTFKKKYFEEKKAHVTHVVRDVKRTLLIKLHASTQWIHVCTQKIPQFSCRSLKILSYITPTRSAKTSWGPLI